MTVPIRRGSIYWVPDTSVTLPPTAMKDRKLHPTRPFLVLSNDEQNAESDWPIVTGFPLTTSDDFHSEFDVRVHKGKANLPDDCWVQVEFLQPIAKEKLREWVGTLDANAVEECVARLFRYMGI